jgi:hypothetical protein
LAENVAAENVAAEDLAAARAASELDDALYYLRRGCVPCADRHFDLALRHGATQDQVDGVRAAHAVAS